MYFTGIVSLSKSISTHHKDTNKGFQSETSAREENASMIEGVVRDTVRVKEQLLGEISHMRVDLLTLMRAVSDSTAQSRTINQLLKSEVDMIHADVGIVQNAVSPISDSIKQLESKLDNMEKAIRRTAGVGKGNPSSSTSNPVEASSGFFLFG